MRKDSFNWLLAIPPEGVDESQWVIALKEQGLLPPSTRHNDHLHLKIRPDEYSDAFLRAQLGHIHKRNKV